MKKNNGKRFEQNFKKSITEDIYYYRFKDGTASWGSNNANNIRFQAKNICDCLLFKKPNLYFLELKNHKGKSIPLSCIKENQIKELTNADKYNGIISGLVINFEDIDRCFFVHIANINDFIENEDRKSIPIKYCEKFGVEIETKKLKVNSRYNIIKMIENIN